MWEFEDLFNKSKLFIHRALDEDDPESSEFIFWCIISLELLARAVLSKIHPSLLADPKDGNNILFACGFPSIKSPISIPAKTVFHRCTVVCAEFTEQDYNDCILWLNWRNEEVHTGSLPLNNIKTSQWLSKFYKIIKILLTECSKTLEDFLGLENAKTANEMVNALDESNKKIAFQMIKDAKEKFNKLGMEERLERIKESENKLKLDWRKEYHGKKVKCPVCEGAALLNGSLVRTSQPKDVEGELVQDEIRLPNEFNCYSCETKISGHELLYSLDLGDQYSKRIYLDPKEYYDISFDPSDYYEPDYGND